MRAFGKAQSLAGVYACLDAASPAIEISVAAGLFHDPGDDANPSTSAPVLDRTP